MALLTVVGTVFILAGGYVFLDGIRTLNYSRPFINGVSPIGAIRDGSGPTLIRGAVQVLDEVENPVDWEDPSDRGRAVALGIWQLEIVRGRGPKRRGIGERRTRWTPMASGIDAGQFNIEDETASVRIDTESLVKKHTIHDAESDATGVEFGESRNPFDSRYIELNRLERQLTRGTHEPFPDSVQRYVEQRVLRLPNEQRRFKFIPLIEGDVVTIYGDATVENGERVLRGTDATPLIISENNPEAVRLRLLKRGVGELAMSLFALSIGGVIVMSQYPAWFGF